MIEIKNEDIKTYDYSDNDLKYVTLEKDGSIIYGYRFFSTMSGINIMFCSHKRAKLKASINEIYNRLMDGEKYEFDDYIDYCANNDIYIVDDETGDLTATFKDTTKTDIGWIADIMGEEYAVDVIARDRGRR